MQFYCDHKRHLVCKPYSVENLHRMANALNLKRCWFHNTKGLAHYDIPLTRVKEITALCVVVSCKEIVQIIKGNL